MEFAQKNNLKSLLELFAIMVFFTFTVFSCSKDDATATAAAAATPPASNRTLDAALGIESVPASLGSTYISNFDAYTKVTTPNGGAIHIVAQTMVTNEQMIRVRNIMEHYLKNLPGSVFGVDKSAVANKMAENNATIALLNGRDDGSNPNPTSAQSLYQEEIQVEGGTWYMNQNYDSHRDAAFEEILHLFHDKGIGVDGANATPGALPDFQKEIRAAQQNALTNKLWGIGAANWISELKTENSLSQEYLAAVIDVYYGLWGAWSGPRGMNDLYIPKIRTDIVTDDPTGEKNIIKNASGKQIFFHPYLTYNARIDAGLNGNFSLKFDNSKPYTNCSRYLKDITLLGSNNNTVTVNQMDNNIIGNLGTNTVIFSGNKSEYTVNTVSGTTTVTDKTANRDGTNTLTNVEKLQFKDQTINL